MKKRWSILFILVLGFFFFFWFIDDQKNEKTGKTSDKNGSYFHPIKITKFSPARIPCINIEIEDKSFEVKLDLGLNHALVLPKEAITSLKEKNFVDSTPIYTFRGKKIQHIRYVIPNVKVNKSVFSNLKILEMDLESENDTVIRKKPSLFQTGKIGWVLFRDLNLFLNCKHSEIAFCDSLETLKKKDGRNVEFIEASLLLEDKLIGFDVETEKGPLRCILDTGSTCNFLNIKHKLDEASCKDEDADKASGQLLNHDVYFELENTTLFNFFKINGVDFGRTEFKCIPIELPIKVDAIVGMEFIYSKLIFIDFTKRKIYFSMPEI